MSRRQSRVSIDVRQNDTLLEFETFKKKFLLANKHITKLNSTLSVRIEELNAQISTLYVENLRLRASEIALTSQLKREREKSRKVIADAEAATHSLIKHLGHIRKSFNVPHGIPSSPETQAAPLPRAKKPVVNPDASPPYTRLARAPTVPGITEDDEEMASSHESPGADAEEDTSPPSPTPVKKRRPKPRTSDPSRLPVPARAAEPPPPDPPTAGFEEELGRVGKRKPTRRQSGLLASMSITTVTASGISTELVPPRPPSPAFGSPLRRSVGLEEQEEERAAARGDTEGHLEEQEVETILDAVARRERKKKREKERESARDGGTDSVRFRDRDREERRRAREQEESAPTENRKFKLKDVTNSHPSEAGSDRERQRTPDAGDASEQAGPSAHSARTFLSTPAPKSSLAAHSNYLPTPRASSPPPPGAMSEPEVGGRERRVRKSINYAEPKLNTKMRKPDSAPSMSKRASTSSSDRASPEVVPPPIPASTDVQPIAGVKRKKSRVYIPPEDGEESEGTQADAEYGGRGNTWAGVEVRRRSAAGAAGLRRLDDDMRRHSLAV